MWCRSSHVIIHVITIVIIVIIDTGLRCLHEKFCICFSVSRLVQLEPPLVHFSLLASFVRHGYVELDITQVHSMYSLCNVLQFLFRFQVCPEPAMITLFCFVISVDVSLLQKGIKILSKCYIAYFGCRTGDRDMSWAAHSVWKSYVENFRQWVAVKKNMSFGGPLVWKEPTNHLDDCRFCMTTLFGFRNRNKTNIAYPNLLFVIPPASHSSEIPILEPPQTFEDSSTDSDDDTQGGTSSPDAGVDYRPGENQQPKLITVITVT